MFFLSALCSFFLEKVLKLTAKSPPCPFFIWKPQRLSFLGGTFPHRGNWKIFWYLFTMNLTVKIFRDCFTMDLTVGKISIHKLRIEKFPEGKFFFWLRTLQNINKGPRYWKCSVCVSEWRFMYQKFRRCTPAPKTQRASFLGTQTGQSFGGTLL